MELSLVIVICDVDGVFLSAAAIFIASPEIIEIVPTRNLELRDNEMYDGLIELFVDLIVHPAHIENSLFAGFYVGRMFIQKF